VGPVRHKESGGGNGKEGPTGPVSGPTARVCVFFFLSFSFLF
jgi:hypothetical protein